MTDAALSNAIRAAVECQGVPWFGRGRVGDPDGLADQLTLALAAAPDMATPECLAGIIGESAQETDWMCSLTEYGGPSTRYAPYYGRGCIQLTWRNNYAGFGQWLHDLGLISDPNAFVDRPDLAAQWPYPWLTAIYYFVRHIGAGYWQSHNWNAISGLVNAGRADYYVPAYELRAKSCNAALAQLSGWKWNGEPDMQLSDIVTRPDGHQASLNDILAYMDQRVERLESVICGGGLEVKSQDGSDAGRRTDVATEVAWLPANVAALRDIIAPLATDEGVRQRIDELIGRITGAYARATQPAGTAAAADGATTRYVVSAGDTLKQVAAAYGTDVQTLLAANTQLGDGNSMRAGDIITIPPKENA